MGEPSEHRVTGVTMKPAQQPERRGHREMARQSERVKRPMAISDNQGDDNAATRQKNQPDSVISDGDWYNEASSP